MRGRTAAALALVALVAGCAPVATAPTGNDGKVCQWVREQVAAGALPVDLAWAWYEHCAPFEVPR